MSNLPAPLTPANCSLKDFPFIPVDVDRLLKSETWVLGTGDERAAAIALWFVSWHQTPAASLPKDDRMLSHLSQSKNWKRVKDHVLRGWVEASDGRLYHPVVAEKALEAWIEKLANSISGATGNAKRWGVDVDTAPLRDQFIHAVSMLSALAPESKSLKKKVVVTIMAGSRGESPPDSPPDIPPDSGGDRNRQGQGQRIDRDSKPLVPTASDGGDQVDLLPTEVPTLAPTAAPTLPPTEAPPPPAMPAKPKKHGTQEDHGCAAYIFGRVRKVVPSAGVPNWDGWANDIRLMRERDGRTHREICELFRWANEDTFWSTNILSPGTLREKWTRLAAKAGQQQANPAAPNLSTEDGRAAQNKIEAEKAARILGFAPPAPPAGDVIDMGGSDAR